MGSRAVTVTLLWVVDRGGVAWHGSGVAVSEADLGQQAVERAWQPPGPAAQQTERDGNQQQPDE